MIQPTVTVHRSLVKTIKTVVTLSQTQYEPILRAAVGAPDNARVEVEDNYGGDIRVSWETTTYEGDE